MDNKDRIPVSSGPHVRGPLTTGGVMYEVILALTPAALFGIWRYGAHAFLIILTAMLTAVLTEYGFDCLAGRENTLRDGSAALTGLLLALTLPADVPLYIPFAGAAFAVIAVKGLFGGLGRNLFNPALGARCALSVAFPQLMASKPAAFGTSAADVLRTLIAHPGGLIGCSALALLAGAVFLLIIRAVSWQIPVSFLACFAVFVLVFRSGGDAPLPSLMAGGVILAACFMAVDPVTSPVTGGGKLVFGGCAGLLAALLLKFTGPAEAACLGVLLANAAVPFLDRRMVARPLVN